MIRMVNNGVEFGINECGVIDIRKISGHELCTPQIIGVFDNLDNLEVEQEPDGTRTILYSEKGNEFGYIFENFCENVFRIIGLNFEYTRYERYA